MNQRIDDRMSRDNRPPTSISGCIRQAQARTQAYHLLPQIRRLMQEQQEANECQMRRIEVIIAHTHNREDTPIFTSNWLTRQPTERPVEAPVESMPAPNQCIMFALSHL